MFRFSLVIALYFCISVLFAQEPESLYATKTWLVETDTISLDSTALNPLYFKLIDSNKDTIVEKDYIVDFSKSQLILLNPDLKKDSLTASFLKLPNFLTKTYTYYPPERVVPNSAGQQMFSYERKKRTNSFVPFEGLETSGSISRGFTMGNNQNGVLSSKLDLQISGKLSENINIRASIQDSDSPLQNGGYSQRIDEFDQIFMEFFSDKWSLKAGDIFLENRNSRFLNFNKKVQGLSTVLNFETQNSKTKIESAVALAKGQYAKSQFIGQEGNQGPYKLKGPNGELYIMIISGSERVYVNGIALKRGENNDYTIDYNSAEIRFTTLYPITSDMRITVEYQYTDRNYTRFVGYGGIVHERKNWSIGGYIFTETDLKNKPLQQKLSEQQTEILKQAGNDSDKMIAPSAYNDSYSNNKVLYKKALDSSGTEYFVYSNNPEDDLYTVNFSMVGNNNGDYIIENTGSIGKIYKYTPPINEIKQGNYAPIIRLVAPIRNTIATVIGKFNPSEKTNINIETAISNNDKNLFSDIDNKENNGWATQIDAKQRLYTGKITVDAFSNFKFIQANFKSLEQLYTIEFDRDWNLDITNGNQNLFTAGIETLISEKSKLTYTIEKLTYGQSFSGNRQSLFGNWESENWKADTKNSYLNAKSDIKKTLFIRSQSDIRYNIKKNWIGGKFEYEHRREKELISDYLSPLSRSFAESTIYIGRGDSTSVYSEIGYSHRINDSTQNGQFKKLSSANTFFFKSNLLKNKHRDLNIYLNYRILVWTDPTVDIDKTLNSKLEYKDRFLDGLIHTNTTYETSSGAIAQQEFTYIEVEPGRGTFTWVDYNNNGIQELEEFEIAPFQDQAKYVRLYLPNQIFVKTHQNKFSQSLIIDPIIWKNSSGYKYWLSHFSNQTSYYIDRRDLRKGNGFNFNPFTSDSQNILGLNESFRNSFSYNKGKQKHSATYIFLKNRTKNLLAFGSQENKIVSHQILYNHLFNKNWLVSFTGKKSNLKTLSNSYESKNYYIKSQSIEPKLSYLFSKEASLDLFYEFHNKENIQNDFEKLNQHRLGTAFLYTSNNSFSINGEFSFYKNVFKGNVSSPVAYQMLEGLQAGKNITWRLMIQKNLTKYLDLNASYQGRATEGSPAIHTGNIQLRAFF